MGSPAAPVTMLAGGGPGAQGEPHGPGPPALRCTLIPLGALYLWNWDMLDRQTRGMTQRQRYRTGSERGALALSFKAVTGLILAGSAVAQTASVENTLLAPSDLSAGDRFGSSLAVDGDLIAVSLQDGAPGGSVGEVRVFERGAGTLSSQAQFQVLGSAPDFGWSLDLDGDRLAVCSGGGGDLVHVFQRSVLGWNLDAIIPAPSGTPTQVSVDLEGDRLVVGVASDGTAGTEAGTAYIYDLSGGAWSLSAQLFADNPAPFQRFGASVGIGSDYVVVGRPTTPSRSPVVWGGVWVYELTSAGWAHTAKLRAPDGGAGREIPVDMAVDGERIVLAEQGSLAAGGPPSGGVHFYERVGGLWLFESTIDPPDPATNDLRWGHQVDLDGDRLLISPRTQPRTWIYRQQASGDWMTEAVVVPRAPWNDVTNVAALGSDYTVIGNPGSDLVVTGGGVVRIYDEPYQSVGNMVCVPGVSMPCPCGNDPGDGVPSGCRSSLGFGSMLVAGGSASVLSDDLRLNLNGDVPSMAVVLWGMPGAAQVRTSFGGLACVGSGARRLALTGAGTQDFGPGLLRLAGASAGETWTFQAVYRDVASTCGEINWTNAVEVTLVP